MKKKIFITGGSGLIGNKLINKLLESNHEVTCYDLAYPKINFKSKNFKFFKGSILDKKKC